MTIHKLLEVFGEDDKTKSLTAYSMVRNLEMVEFSFINLKLVILYKSAKKSSLLSLKRLYLYIPALNFTLMVLGR